MGRLSERENFYKLVRGERPNYVPWQPGLLQILYSSVVLDRPKGKRPGQDWFGVWWNEDPETPGMLAVDISKPYVLKDIEDWEEAITWPDLASIDWKTAALSDLPEGKDPARILIAFSVSGPFERLHDLLGFEEALVATVISPETCGAFFERYCDYKIEMIGYLKKYYDIDAVHFQDDWGTQKDLFFRPEFWRTYIKPYIKRVIDAVKAMGVVFVMHSCGKIDLIVDEIVEMGIDIIDPTQPVNDLTRWKQDFGNQVIFMGGLDAQNIIDNPRRTIEEIKQEVHEKIDLLATDGRYIPFSVSLTPRLEIALNEVFIYGRRFYGEDYEEEISAFERERGLA
jgi:hypothetical protein